MHLLKIVNVENLKLFEPLMLDQETKQEVQHIIEVLAPKSHTNLVEDIFL